MRVNIESSALAEGRFNKLAQEYFEGSRAEAIGSLVLFWFDSQEREFVSGSKERIKEFMPFLNEAENNGFFNALLKYGYIKEIGPDLFEIAGNNKHVRKLKDFKELQSERGKKSAEVRRLKYGSAAPFMGSNNRTESEPGSEPGSNDQYSNSNIERLNQNGPVQAVDSVEPDESTKPFTSKGKNESAEPSRTIAVQFNAVQCSSIQHKQQQKKKNVCEGFEKAWAIYPNQVDRGDAEKRYRRLIKTEAEANALLSAIPKYVADCHRENRKLKHFATFLGVEDNQRWKEWVNRKPPQQKTFFAPPPEPDGPDPRDGPLKPEIKNLLDIAKGIRR